MTRYLVKRALWALFVLSTVVSAVFFLVHVAGDPAAVALGPRANADAIRLGILDPDDPEAMARYFYAQLQVYPSVGYLSFGSAEGTFVGIEREQDYIDAARARIDAVEPLGKNELTVLTGKRAEPRVAFNVLIEAGHVKPGDVLHDAKRKHQAIVRADGTLVANGTAGSIHKVGAVVQGFDACNGWTFWHIDSKKGLTPIDTLRQTMREQMAVEAV